MALLLLPLLACASTYRLLHLSDIHYNPLFDPRFPWCQNPDDATRSPDASRYKYGKIGCNPPMGLVDAVFADARAKDRYDAIVMSGDLVSHELSEDVYEQAFAAMVAKFREYFGATPVVFSMGNNDTPRPFNITCSDSSFAFIYTQLKDYIPGLSFRRLVSREGGI